MCHIRLIHARHQIFGRSFRLAQRGISCKDRRRMAQGMLFLTCVRSCSNLRFSMQLHVDRTYLGNVMGSLESWLLLRSLRTLHLRVPRQSETSTALAQWLSSASAKSAGESFDGIPGGLIAKVWHSSLQKKDARGFDPKTQLEGGWNATFAILVSSSTPTHSEARVFDSIY
jgi:hypothetical protein